jgi:hypothetical protein
MLANLVFSVTYAISMALNKIRLTGLPAILLVRLLGDLHAFVPHSDPPLALFESATSKKTHSDPEDVFGSVENVSTRQSPTCLFSLGADLARLFR